MPEQNAFASFARFSLHPCLSAVNVHELSGGFRRLQEQLQVENVVSEEALMNGMDITVMYVNEQADRE